MLFSRDAAVLERPSRLPRPAAWRMPSGAFGPAELIALAAATLIVLLAVLGPLLMPYNPITRSGEAYLPPFSPGHLLGTDNLGFDIATRIVHGLRSSLGAAVVVTAVAALAGLVIGAAAGFLGGVVDSVLMRVTDLFLAFPATVVAMAVAAGLGPSLSSLMIGISVVWWPLYARLVRGEVRRVATSSHVEAARLSGTRGVRLVTRHVIPAVLPTVVVTASLDIGAVIMTVAGLSFIGLGSPAPRPELGLMASAGMQYILTAPWIPVIPGLVVGLLALVFNYLGDGMRNILRSKGA